MNTSDIPCLKMAEDIGNLSTSNDFLFLKIVSYFNNNNNWFDRVYLCYENTPTNSLPIKGFKCYRYNNFESADIGWKKYAENNNYDIRHTMIPICKWVPEIYDKYILNWKLKKMYWLGQHIIYKKKNK